MRQASGVDWHAWYASASDEEKYAFDERAGILQFEGKLPKEKAEALAWLFVKQKQNP